MSADVTIIRRPVKHARLRVSEDGTVRLIAPEDWEAERVTGILEKKEGWIRDQQSKFQGRVSMEFQLESNQMILHGDVFQVVEEIGPQRQCKVDTNSRTIYLRNACHSADQREVALRSYGVRYLKERTLSLAKRHRFSFNRIFIRSQATKWGNCSRLKNISLNWRLILMPEFVSDYVILHELLHTQIMNHSQRFWLTLRAIHPQTEHAVKWLGENTSRLAP